MSFLKTRNDKARALVIIAAILLIIALTLSLDKIFGGSNYENEEASVVVINGIKYEERNLSTFLIIGIDDFGEIKSSDSYNNTNQADFVAVLAFDHTNKTYSVLHLNRDSMVDIDMLSITGELTGNTINAQLAVSHTFGDGTEVSAMNTRRAVSRILKGVKPDYFITMSMDGIKALNDYIGGVTVTMDKDYTSIDPAYTEGSEALLLGDNALNFVRARRNVEDGTNLSRMDRQKAYVRAFVNKLMAADMNDSFINGAFEEVAGKKYILTNASVNDAKSVIKDINSYSFDGLYSPEGEAYVKDGFMQFDIDEDSLNSIITKLYFDECK